MNYPKTIESLIEHLTKFPGIGRRSAERIVNHILGASDRDIKALIHSLIQVKQKVRLCKNCNNLTDAEVCSICHDLKRRKDLICVVEYPSDVIAIEKSGKYHGIYYVLNFYDNA